MPAVFHNNDGKYVMTLDTNKIEAIKAGTPQQEQVLIGQTILVTGAGDGIGRAVAFACAKQGATVILLGRTESKLNSLYDEIEKAGYPTPAIIPLDLKDATKENYVALATSIKESLGNLDAIVHNAGVLGHLSPFEHIEEDVFDNVMQVNVKAGLLLTQATIPLLLQSKNPSILFTSSSVGKKGKAFWASYAISKFATEGMMQTLADEYESSNLRVNTINPGANQTAMRALAFPGETPDSLISPDQIAPLYTYLLSTLANDVHGQSINAQPLRKPS